MKNYAGTVEVTKGGSKSMKQLLLVLPLFYLAVAGTPAVANNSTNTITAPTEGQEIVVDSLPTTVIVTGTITHSPSNVNDQIICVRLDGVTDTCLPALSGLGNAQTYNYSIPVQIGTAGTHTLQGINANSNGDHRGASSIVNITITLSQVICDGRDPPAHANQYLNERNLPQNFATFRGQVISIIAFYFNSGRYGTCTYDYPLVEADVEQLLGVLGF